MKPRRSLTSLLSLTLALTALGSSTFAQDDPPIELVPVEPGAYGITSVAPTSWSDIGLGQFARGVPPEDWTILALQTIPGPAADLLALVSSQLALPVPPEPTGEYATDVFEWTLHSFETALPAPVAGELALVEADGTTYLAMLLAAPEEFEGLRESVLMPALDAYALLEPESASETASAEYLSEEVTFQGAADDVELAGTLTLPKGPGPHPVVVLMSGSGPSDRDESLAPISTFKPFAILADALTSAGVGVLRYDDRGVGESTGDHGAASIEDFAADAATAIDYLATREDVDPDRVGIFGHSEGGFYAAMLGASHPQVAYIGLMAPAVVDGINLIVEQNVAVTRAAGASDELVAAAGDLAAEIMPLVVAGEIDEVERIGREFYGWVWDGLTPEEQAASGPRDTFIAEGFDVQMPVYRTDWYRSFLDYDPAIDWQQVSVPVLGIFGGKDVQTIAETNEAALREALSVAGNEDVTTLTIPEANHLFQDAETGAFSEYAQLEPEFIDGFVETVVDWMVERTGADGQT